MRRERVSRGSCLVPATFLPGQSGGKTAKVLTSTARPLRETRRSQRAAERKLVISQILFPSYLVIRFNIIDKVNDLSMKNKDILLHQFSNTRNQSPRPCYTTVWLFVKVVL